jgi:hypothetical protein
MIIINNNNNNNKNIEQIRKVLGFKIYYSSKEQSHVYSLAAYGVVGGTPVRRKERVIACL